MSCANEFKAKSKAVSAASGVPPSVAVLEYRYVDASNYKHHGELAFNNPDGISLDAAKRIFKNHAESGEFFVAEQIGVPIQYFSSFSEDDHGFHSYSDWEDGTGGKYDLTDDRTLKEFLEEVSEVEAWEPDPDRLGYDDDENWDEDEELL